MNTVLLIDDDTDCREVLGFLLLEAGYDVLNAADGQEGLDLLVAGPMPQLILLDLDMPRMDGRRFRQVQQKLPVVAAVPVIVLSGSMDGEAEARRLNAAGYLRKPIGRERLIGTVSRLCHRDHGSSAQPA